MGAEGDSTEGKEVSARAVIPVVSRARRLGHDPAPLFEGLPFGEAELRRRNFRLSWEDFTRFWGRAEALLGGPAGMEEMGVDLMRVSPLLKLMSRVFLSVDRLYLQMAPRIGRSNYTNFRVSARALDDGRFVYEQSVLDGRQIPPSFGSATAGLFRAYPTLFGLPEAVVAMTLRAGHQRFDITPPARRPFSTWGLLSAPLPPEPALEEDFAAPEEIIDLLDSPSKPSDRIPAMGARLLAAPDLETTAKETLDALEAFFLCTSASVWTVTPQATLRLVAARSPDERKATLSRTLISGGKVVGRLDVDGEVLNDASTQLVDFDAFLPWIGMAVAARLEAAGGAGDTLEARAKALSLTERELEVLRWIREGKTNPEIGQILGISHRTVHKHVENLLRKMGAETRLAAARQSLHWRWGEDPRAG